METPKTFDYSPPTESKNLPEPWTKIDIVTKTYDELVEYRQRVLAIVRQELPVAGQKLAQRYNLLATTHRLRGLSHAEIPAKPIDHLVDGDTVTMTIDGQEITCTFRDFNAFDFSEKNSEVKYLQKLEPVRVRFTKKEEEIITRQDGIATARIALPGQIIIQNKPNAAHPEDPYIFGNEGQDSTEQRKAFESMYQHIEGTEDLYRKTTLIKVIRVNEPTAIRPSWDRSQLMATPAGGVVAEGEYTISPSSLEASYRFVEPEAAHKAA